MSEIVCPDCGVRMLSIVAYTCNDGKQRCGRCTHASPKAQAQTPTWTCGLCKARFASEMAMQSHVCETPSFQLHHENRQLRARVKELEAEHLTEPIQSFQCEDMLRIADPGDEGRWTPRVGPMVASYIRWLEMMAKQTHPRNVDSDVAYARMEEDLARKRDECARLEAALAEQSKQREFYATQANCKTFEVGELAMQNAKLRRELRGKR